MWTCGFELQSVTALVETQDVNTVGGAPSISTSIHRGGAASLRVTPTAGTSYVEHQLTSGVVMRTFHRFYLYISALPAADCNIYGIGQSGYFPGMIRLKTDGSLILRDDQTGTDLGSATSPLNIGQWYRIEADFNDVTGTITSGVSAFKLYVDGTLASDQLCSNINGFSRVRAGALQSANSLDIYIDDIAVNDTSGTAQTGLPGPGTVVHLRPAGAGDNNLFATVVGGTAGAANNYTRVSEVTPDDATSYNATVATGTTTIDDFAVSSPTTAGIGASDAITLVSVGARIGSNATTAASIVTRIKGQAAGTVSESASTSVNVNGWSTHKAAVPRLYQLTAYANPQTSTAWTRTTLATAQIGYRSNVSQTTARRISTLWALVEYVPVNAVTGDGSLTGTATTSSSGAIGAGGGGTLAATAGASAAGQRQTAGGGSLTATATATASGTISAASGGSLTGAASGTADGSRAAASTGTLAATAAATASGTLAGVGNGTLVATGTASAASAVAAVGAGSVTGTAGLTGSGARATTGAATLAATSAATAAGSVATAGAGTLTATATSTAAGSIGRAIDGSLQATATLTGAGVRAADGTGSLTAAATASAAGALATAADATLDVTAGLTSAGVPGRTGTAVLAATATVTSDGIRATAGLADLAVTATATADSAVSSQSSGSLAVIAATAASGSVSAAGDSDASLTVAATINASGQLAAAGSGELAALADTTAAGVRDAVSTAALTATAATTAAGSRDTAGEAPAVDVAATLAADAIVQTADDGTLVGLATVDADGIVTAGGSGAALLAATAVLTAAGTLTVRGTGTFNATAAATASGTVTRTITGQLAVLTSLVAAGTVTGGQPVEQLDTLTAGAPRTRWAAGTLRTRHETGAPYSSWTAQQPHT
ncbi:hypothetical protein [Streptomyces sp. NPDC058202]|uniref:hypothetical protein n=1 Tax=Streptomyces sp. NPDC058202 TaxID=3346380 RepID=UPI0036E119F8